jgi:hypothetical protein
MSAAPFIPIMARETANNYVDNIAWSKILLRPYELNVRV